MDTEERVGKLEGRTDRLEIEFAEMRADLAVIKSNYVTRADLLEMERRFDSKLNALTWRVIGFVTAMTSIQIAVMVYLIRAIH